MEKKKLILSQNHYFEHLEEAEPMLGKYFTSLHSHCVHDQIEENAAYFCCSFKHEKNVCITGSIHLVVNNMPTIFFDKIDTFIAVSEREAQQETKKAISIYVNDRFAGYWLPKMNTLVATDWTHNYRCIEVLKEIWPKLVYELGLKPLLDEKNKEMFRKRLILPDGAIVVLYGLHQERDNIASIPIPGIKLLEDPPYNHLERGRFWIGLLWKVRMEEITEEEVKEICKVIKKWVENLVKENE